MKAIICLLLLGVGLSSQLVLAHPGHDHASWTSPLIHSLTFFAIGAVLISAGVLYKQSRRQKTRQQEERKDS